MIISHHLCGLGYYETRKIFSFLDLPYMNFRAFKRCEEFVGKNGLEKVTKKVIQNALQEEIQLTNEVYDTDKYKKLPALTVSLDMGWQKRSSGRRYDSPSGVLHCIGARSGKIIFSFVYRNHCDYCMKLGFLMENYEDNKDNLCDEEKIKLQRKIDGLCKHTCLKNFDGYSKSMECDAIVDLVSNAPKRLGCYIRSIVMDDDTNVRDNLEEDLGDKKSGRLEKCLAGITFYADPGHRKRTYQNHLFELVGGIRKKGWMLRRKQAKQLAIHFAYFQQQIKGLTLEEAKIKCSAPMKHIIGNHEDCGEWCTGKRAKMVGLRHNKPPMFDINLMTDRLTFEEVKKVFQHFTTEERLLEMLKFFTTNGNESLNMRLAELAPKYKNYSRTGTLDYRQQMVIGHHNLGMHLFYSEVFKHLTLHLSDHLASFLQHRDSLKKWKKEYDNDPKIKARRKWKYQAKDKETLLIEATRAPKEGTYETGVAMKRTKDKDTRGDSGAKKRKKGSIVIVEQKNHIKTRAVSTVSHPRSKGMMRDLLMTLQPKLYKKLT